MSAAGNALEVIHLHDPKRVLLERAKPLADSIDVYGDDALIAVYTREDAKDASGNTRTATGIILPDNVLAEDLYQGKIGLLMKVGPQFGSTENGAFFGDSVPKVGDWVMFRVGDTYSFKVKKQLFRTCEAKQLRGRVSKPDVIW